MVKWKRERRYISKLLIKTSEGNGYKHFKKVTLRIQELQVAYRFVWVLDTNFFKKSK